MIPTVAPFSGRNAHDGRKGAITECWGYLRNAYPHRFTAEMRRLTGIECDNHDPGFEALCEAVELTALKRGCERWTPVAQGCS